MDSVSGTIQHSYDNLDRLTSEITPQGTVSYTYDAANRRATMTAGNQPQTTYSYDNADRLTGITQGTQSVAFTYDNADRRATLTLPNGIVVSYGYDNASQLTAMTYTLDANTLGNLAYTYDTNGRRNSVGGSWARTNLPAALASATYDAANQLTQWGATTLTYDANGNMTNDGTNTLTWNARNQLSSMSGGVTASFQNDPLGRRVNKTIGGVSTGFLHDGINPVQEQLGGRVYANLFTGGVDEFFSRTDQLGTQTHLPDALGSTLGLANTSGTILTTYAYEPFGKVSSSGPTFTPFQFTGRENDGTGFLFYRARFYSPLLGRFVSEDPLGPIDDLNLYAYVGNDPLDFTDPLGLYSFDQLLYDAAQVSAGAGDNLSMGLTRWARGQGDDSLINKSGGLYNAGEWVGTGIGLAFGAAHVGRNIVYQATSGGFTKAVIRIFSDPRGWKQVSKVWSKAMGNGVRATKDAGISLHHWLIPQRWGLPNAITNAG